MGFFDKIRKGLTKTKESLIKNIESVVIGYATIDEDFLEDLEMVLLSGDIEIEQRLEKGDRVWHSVALTQMNRPAGADFTKINELGIKVDTMEVTASFGASNVLDYKEHRRKGWRLFYTLFQMITAEDGVSTRASLYSDPVYFEE